MLQEQGLLEKTEDHEHAVGHCYRCHTVIEPYLSDQWFVKMQPLAQEAIQVVEEGKVDTTKVKVIWTTPTYFDYNWTVRGDMDPALQEKIKQAFLSLDPAVPAQAEILKLQRATRFIETKPENYLGIEAAATQAGLLK